MTTYWLQEHYDDTFRITQAGRNERDSVIGTLRRWLESTSVQNIPSIILDPCYGERIFDARTLELFFEAGDLGISIGEIWRTTKLIPEELEYILRRLEQKEYIEKT